MTKKQQVKKDDVEDKEDDPEPASVKKAAQVKDMGARTNADRFDQADKADNADKAD